MEPWQLLLKQLSQETGWSPFPGGFLPPHPKHTYVQPKCVIIKPLATYMVLLSIEFQSAVVSSSRLRSAGGVSSLPQSQGLSKEPFPCVILLTTREYSLWGTHPSHQEGIWPACYLQGVLPRCYFCQQAMHCWALFMGWAGNLSLSSIQGKKPALESEAVQTWILG